MNTYTLKFHVPLILIIAMASIIPMLVTGILVLFIFPFAKENPWIIFPVLIIFFADAYLMFSLATGKADFSIDEKGISIQPKGFSFFYKTTKFYTWDQIEYSHSLYNIHQVNGIKISFKNPGWNIIVQKDLKDYPEFAEKFANYYKKKK